MGPADRPGGTDVRKYEDRRHPTGRDDFANVAYLRIQQVETLRISIRRFEYRPMTADCADGRGCRSRNTVYRIDQVILRQSATSRSLPFPNRHCSNCILLRLIVSESGSISFPQPRREVHLPIARPCRSVASSEEFARLSRKLLQVRRCSRKLEALAHSDWPFTAMIQHEIAILPVGCQHSFGFSSRQQATLRGPTSTITRRVRCGAATSISSTSSSI